MMKKYLIIIGLIASMVPGSLLANSNIGTSGAQFLKIGAGARPAAMGSAYIGISDDVNAVYYNPAGLSHISRPQFTAMHTEYFQDINYDFGAFAYPTNYGAFGISAATLKVEDLSKRGTDESLIGNFDAQDAVYALSFARNLGPLFSIGLTGKYLEQKIDTVSAGTWAGDVGLMKRFPHKRFSFGATVRHIGQEVKFNEESDPLPLTYGVGGGFNFFKEKLIIGLDVTKPRDNDVQFGAGYEINKPLANGMKLSLRNGYNTLGTDADGTTGISFGGGISFTRFNINFAWVPFGDLGDSFRTSALIKF